MSFVASTNLRARFAITRSNGDGGGSGTLLIPAQEDRVAMIDEVLTKLVLSELIRTGDDVMVRFPLFCVSVKVDGLTLKKKKEGRA